MLMKAMSLSNASSVHNNPLTLVEKPVQKLGEYEVRIKIHVCGVCRTDLHIVEGDLPFPKLPIIPGHQIVGTIDAIGNKVTNFNTGDRVGVPWMSSTCGECPFCSSQHENLCDSAQFTGLHIDGGYAEFTVVPQQFVYPLPEDFPDEQIAPLLCAGIIGYRTLKQSRFQPGQRIGLYGFGASAHVSIQVAKHFGCDVYVFTRSTDHQKHAEELGATWTGTAEEDPGANMDASLVFAPVGWLMVEALKRTRKGGAVVSAGIHMTDIPEFPYRHLYGERTLTSASNATYEDGTELLTLAVEIPIKTDVKIYSLQDVNIALQDLKGSQFKGAAVLRVRGI